MGQTEEYLQNKLIEAQIKELEARASLYKKAEDLLQTYQTTLALAHQVAEIGLSEVTKGKW